MTGACFWKPEAVVEGGGGYVELVYLL